MSIDSKYNQNKQISHPSNYLRDEDRLVRIIREQEKKLSQYGNKNSHELQQNAQEILLSYFEEVRIKYLKINIIYLL